jgi:hypothetical protein
MFEEILPNFKGDKRMYIYSAHDTTFARLAPFFDVPGFLWPPFAANLVLEVWDVSGTSKLRVIYEGNPIKTVDLEPFLEQMRRELEKGQCEF